MQPLHLAIFVIFAVAGVSVLGHKTQQNILKPNTSSTQWHTDNGKNFAYKFSAVRKPRDTGKIYSCWWWALKILRFSRRKRCKIRLCNII